MVACSALGEVVYGLRFEEAPAAVSSAVSRGG